MYEMGLHDLFGYLKHKLWQKKRPGVKKNSRIALISLHADGVPYTVGKLSTTATMFF